MDAHPLAALVPQMSKQEFEELLGDIAEHGLREDIVTLDGQVLDGRHRLRACEEAGIKPRFRKFRGDDPAAFVLSVNVRRRHLSASQRAMLATKFLPELQREAADRRARLGRERGGRPSVPMGTEGPPRRATDDAAAASGVSPRTVARAQRVVEHDPALAEKVEAGEVTVRQAERRLTVVEAVEPLGEEAQEQARSGATEEEILQAAAESNPQLAASLQEAKDARLDSLLAAWISASNPIEIAKDSTMSWLDRSSRRELEYRLKRLTAMEALAHELAVHIQSKLTMPLREAN